MHSSHAATSRVENTAQVLFCQLKFVHDSTDINSLEEKMKKNSTDETYIGNLKNAQILAKVIWLKAIKFFSQKIRKKFGPWITKFSKTNFFY